ncbi:hypothetical protein ACFRLW_24460 [Streptomyces sp. NPDC056728]
MIRSPDRVNRTTPPPGAGSAPVTGPGTLARSGPLGRRPTASARLLRHEDRTARKPWTAPTKPTALTARTRSRPFMLLTLSLRGAQR